LTLQGTAIFSSYLTDLAAPQYGPLLFWRITQASYTTTQAHANNARRQLKELSPKSFGYDITKMNAYVRQLTATVRASSDNAAISNAELSCALVDAYSRIQSPLDWVQWTGFIKYSDTNYKPEQLMTRAEQTYHELRDKQEWRPSDKSPTESALAMAAQVKTPPAQHSRPSRAPHNGRGGGLHGRNNRNGQRSFGNNERSPPPFAKDHGKKGDTRQHQGRTWYWCPAEHVNGHWQVHSPDQCRLLRRSTPPAGRSNFGRNAPAPQVEVNERNVKSLQAVLETNLDDEDTNYNSFNNLFTRF
jgi:hypothetical protein